MITLTVKIDDELCSKARAILEPQGLTLEDALRTFIEYCGNPKNEKAATEMIRRWIDEDKADSNNIST